MSPKVRKILSILFVVLCIAAVIIIAFSGTELKDAWSTILSLKREWVILAFVSWVVYAMSDSLGNRIYLHSRGFSLSMPRMMHITLLGFFYSNITPSAAGGQPMQVSAMRKAGVPVAYGTASVTIRFVANQFAITMLALVLFLLNRSYVYEILGDAMWFVRIGWLINFSTVPLVLMAAFQTNLVRKLVSGLIRLGVKLHLVRNPEKAARSAEETVNTYGAAMRDLIHHPGQILLQLACSLLSMLGVTGCTVFVYHAFGLSGTSPLQLLTLSALLFVSASYTPLPGASGAQEGGFLLFYQKVFTGGTSHPALLVWRFFTYYLFLLAGLVVLLLDKFVKRRESQIPAGAKVPEAPETKEEEVSPSGPDDALP